MTKSVWISDHHTHHAVRPQTVATKFTFTFMAFWQTALSRATYIHLIYATEQLRALLRGPAVAAGQCPGLNLRLVDQRLNH